MTNLNELFGEIRDERAAQDNRWGIQDHPSVQNVSSDKRAQFEDRAKTACQKAFKSGTGTWEHIACEEYFEALAASDDAARRGELIQLAAVIVAWIECIDRRIK